MLFLLVCSWLVLLPSMSNATVPNTSSFCCFIGMHLVSLVVTNPQTHGPHLHSYPGPHFLYAPRTQVVNKALPYRVPFPSWYAKTVGFLKTWLVERFLGVGSDFELDHAAFDYGGVTFVSSRQSTKSSLTDVNQQRERRDLLNAGKDCWLECGQSDGFCDFCGR